MPKSKEFIESSSDSENSESEKPKAKKKKVEEKKKQSGEDESTKTKKDKDGNVMFQLSKMRFATVCKFHGKKMVNIREFYEADGDLRPGKKGIALNEEQWRALRDVVGDIDTALDDL